MSNERAPTPLDADVQSFITLCRTRFGDRLTDDQLPRLEQSVRNLRRTAAEMAEFELANGDEPATTFRAGSGA